MPQKIKAKFSECVNGNDAVLKILASQRLPYEYNAENMVFSCFIDEKHWTLFAADHLLWCDDGAVKALNYADLISATMLFHDRIKKEGIIPMMIIDKDGVISFLPFNDNSVGAAYGVLHMIPQFYIRDRECDPSDNSAELHKILEEKRMSIDKQLTLEKQKNKNR